MREGLRDKGRRLRALVDGFMKVVEGIAVKSGFTNNKVLALDARMLVLSLEELEIH